MLKDFKALLMWGTCSTWRSRSSRRRVYHGGELPRQHHPELLRRDHQREPQLQPADVHPERHLTGRSETGGLVNALPMLHSRYPVDRQAPSMDEIVRMKSYDWEGSGIWGGEAELTLGESPIEELASIAQREMIGASCRSVGVSWGIGTRLE